MSTIGTCSKCNGPVQVPDLWGGTVPPVPTCAHCGATAKDPYGPTIPMEKRSPSRTDAQQPAAGTHVEFVKWFNSCGVQDRPPSQLARAAWDAALSSQQAAAVDGAAVDRVAAALLEEATDEPWTVAGVEHEAPDRDYYRKLARKVLALATQHREESKWKT